ncbi:MAG: ATPase, partial [Rhodobacteraceae bacterium]
AWQAVIVDELWQEEKWGFDEDATALRQVKSAAFAHAAIFFAAAEKADLG